MNIYQKVTWRIKNIITLLLPSKMRENAEERKYYKKLFIDNEYWNRPSANDEEELRWQIIQQFITRHVLSTGQKLEILDLGCGRGWLTNLISQYGNIIGIEPVKSVVKYGKTLYPNLNLMSGSTGKLLKKGYHEKFNLVVCSEVIEHIKDNRKNKFVDEISSLLKRGGFCIITTPRKDAEIEWKKYSDPNQPVEDWMTEKDLENLFISRGFDTILLERLSIKPNSNSPSIEIYQLWLFKKKS